MVIISMHCISFSFCDIQQDAWQSTKFCCCNMVVRNSYKELLPLVYTTGTIVKFMWHFVCALSTVCLPFWVCDIQKCIWKSPFRFWVVAICIFAMQELYSDWLSDSEFFPYAFLHSVAMQELCCDCLKWPTGGSWYEQRGDIVANENLLLCTFLMHHTYKVLRIHNSAEDTHQE